MYRRAIVALDGSQVAETIMPFIGRSGLGRLLFGSVAETVLRASELPVFLMRSTEADVARLASAADLPDPAVTPQGSRR